MMQTASYQQFQARLGRRIRSARKARGLSQEKLGELVEMDRVSIGYLEQGRRTPKLSTLFALAEALDVDVSVFFESSDADDAASSSQGSAS